MPLVQVDFELDLDPDGAWELFGDFSAPPRLAPGFVTNCTVDGDIRTVTFANGVVARERLVSLDPSRRQLAYTIVGGQSEHHHAVFKLLPLECGGTAVQWTADFLPDTLAPMFQGMMEEGARVMRRHLRRKDRAADPTAALVS